MYKLEEVMEETAGLLQKAIEERVLSNREFILKMHLKLARANLTKSTLRSEILGFESRRVQEYLHILGVLSHAIDRCRREVKEIKVAILAETESERQLLYNEEIIILSSGVIRSSGAILSSGFSATKFPRHSPHYALCRSYALSVVPPKIPKGMTLLRHFTGKKAFQYNWYTRILNSSSTSPLIFLYHNDFTSQKLIKLRRDISAASKPSKPTLSAASPAGAPVEPAEEPLLTVIRSSIFGAALRDFPTVENADVMRMTDGVSGALAVLSLPVLDPPQLKSILRTFDRNVPPRKPKTEAELKKELDEKNADPANPGRRLKRMKQVVDPELRVLGVLLDGQILLPDRVKDLAELPTLQTLREQLVGLLSSPGTQLAMTLSEAAGGRLARTLEGLKKGLEETSGDVPPP
ncbi:hypothetical protein FB451DRAFT_1360947 [Mycena latifolia]|nr:hypothetical protein FB451DRAFT_1360947 [Mycena latifolia]